MEQIERNMSRKPLISVVMPVHNAGVFLPDAVESILQQSYPHFELIMVDDHSTDGAIEQLSIHDPRIKIIPSSTCGVVHAMRQGVREAKGEYLARMDADDEALPHRLQLQLDYMTNNPEIGIAAAQVEIFSDNGVDQGFQHYQQWLNNVCTPVEISKELFIESPLPNPTVMFRRDVYQQLGGYQDSEWAEDYDCWLRADVQKIKMGKPEGVLLRWRNHENRLTHNDERYSQNNFMRAKAHYLARTHLKDKEVIIWGTGPTGLKVHDLLQEENIKMKGFIEINSRRIGGEKRGLPVWPIDYVETLSNEIIIGAVGSRGAREEIRTYLEEKEFKEGEQFIFIA